MAKKNKVDIKGILIRWAKIRSGLNELELSKRFPRIEEWETEEDKPTLSQLKDFAKVTHTPLGYLFLLEPPQEPLPVPLFRTVGDRPIHSPSPELLDTIQTMQRRQDWMRDFLITEGESPLQFVGSLNINTDIKIAANTIRTALRLEMNWAKGHTKWTDALLALRRAIDGIGIMVTRNGVVGSNTHRKLSVEEFRGFVLADEYAPLVFINGLDWEGAQMFTLAHELAHIWLGFGSIFNLLNLQPEDDDREKFCNKVAAEFLVPEDELKNVWKDAKQEQDYYKFLSKNFKVSRIVIARRLLDLDYISKDEFFDFYNKYREPHEENLRLKKEKNKKNKKQTGDFYKTANVRIGTRFASAIFYAAKSELISYRDAFRLTGLYGGTFDRFFRELGYK